ncbi:hypothetical protein [Streptomyces bohaiensis]|uniref:WXG100 family type VII secretion target n=3 Tax=Streptomyces bohaiensis TaxID=1431344 RepID=A0ABX1CD87_9ACTN|nr:hypothetical protein [Streptomyces bohaiensis]NJQ15715.1 hypothetical protein [Streptomyces bohaiensis]
MTTDEEFQQRIRVIRSARHYRIAASSGAWLLLAQAALGENTEMGGISANVSAEHGVGLLSLAERIDGASAWLSDAGNVAQTIAEQLVRAGNSAAEALWRGEEVQGRYDEAAADLKERMQHADGMVLASISENGISRKQELIDEAQGIVDELSAEFALVVGGEAPAAPGGGGAAGGGAPSAGGVAGGGVGGAVGHAGGTAAGVADFAAGNGSVIGMGEYPHGRVLGPERGDFAGWVQNPTTGFLTDPATGREFDSVAGRWIDPVTGRPFGEVTEYASRLSGLGGGPGAVAGISGGTALVGAGAAGGLAGLYGGTVPPSVAQAGPMRGQTTGQAMRNLSHRAGVAGRFAAAEAAQGGRPFTAPPAHNPGGRVTGRPAGAVAGRAAAPPNGKAGAVDRRSPVGHRGGAPLATGARGFAPPPVSTTPARSGARDTKPTRGTTGSRAAGRVPGDRLGAPPPQNTTRPNEERRTDQKPTDLTERRSVWESDRRASGGVLGE